MGPRTDSVRVEMPKLIEIFEDAQTDSVRVEMPTCTQNVIYFRAITLWYQIDVGVCPDFLYCCTIKPRRESTKREEESEKSNVRLGFEIALASNILKNICICK